MVAHVVLPTQTALKAMLHRAMRAQNLRKADLERRLGLHGPQVDRLLNPRHASRLDQIEAALAAEAAGGGCGGGGVIRCRMPSSKTHQTVTA